MVVRLRGGDRAQTAGAVRRGGYLTRRDAVAARDALLNRSAEDRGVDGGPVAAVLADHPDQHPPVHAALLHRARRTAPAPAPGPGPARRADRPAGRRHVPGTGGHQQPLGPPPRRIRATLRSALNAAIRDGLLRDNPARHIELPSPRRPHAQVWTDHRVAARRERGERSAVAVWTVQQLTGFFGFVADDRLYALWWLIALRGLYRGEATGLRWTDVDLDARVVVIGQQRIAYGHTVAVGPGSPVSLSQSSPGVDPAPSWAARRKDDTSDGEFGSDRLPDTRLASPRHPGHLGSPRA
jgi:hypothetical protein